MRISVVREDDYSLDGNPSEVILQKHSEHVPNQGDVIKVGHSLSGYDAFTVNRRVFRSYPGKEHDTEAFQEVIVLVNEA